MMTRWTMMCLGVGLIVWSSVGWADGSATVKRVGKPSMPVDVTFSPDGPVAVSGPIEVTVSVRPRRDCESPVITVRGMDGLTVESSEAAWTGGSCRGGITMLHSVTVRVAPGAVGTLAADVRMTMDGRPVVATRSARLYDSSLSMGDLRSRNRTEMGRGRAGKAVRVMRAEEIPGK